MKANLFIPIRKDSALYWHLILEPLVVARAVSMAVDQVADVDRTHCRFDGRLIDVHDCSIGAVSSVTQAFLACLVGEGLPRFDALRKKLALPFG